MSTDIATIYILVTRRAAVNFAALKQFVAVSSLKLLSLSPSFLILHVMDKNILTHSSLLYLSQTIFLVAMWKYLIWKAVNRGIKYISELCLAYFNDSN